MQVLSTKVSVPAARSGGREGTDRVFLAQQPDWLLGGLAEGPRRVRDGVQMQGWDRVRSHLCLVGRAQRAELQHIMGF